MWLAKINGDGSGGLRGGGSLRGRIAETIVPKNWVWGRIFVGYTFRVLQKITQKSNCKLCFGYSEKEMIY